MPVDACEVIATSLFLAAGIAGRAMIDKPADGRQAPIVDNWQAEQEARPAHGTASNCRSHGSGGNADLC
jgi:hypothetical protein